MKMTSPHTVARQMNHCAAAHTPFLFAFDFELENAIFMENPLEQQDILFRTPLGGNSTVKRKDIDTRLTAHPMSLEAYQQRFDTISHGLHRGDSFLANLTVQTPIACNASMLDIFETSRAPYCLLVPEHFVCFSPEIFVRIEGNTISTFPMKGTIDAALPNARETILNDPKETAEHVTVVDLLRNDLGLNANEVEVARFRYIDQIDTPQRSILQVSSEIKGTLSNDWQAKLGDIILSMLPAGSVSGAPKKATIHLIHKAEQGQKRGFYTGVFGYYDGERLDSGVLIRYIEEVQGKFYFRSGGGITVNSNCLSEYNETIEKIYLPAT